LIRLEFCDLGASGRDEFFVTTEALAAVTTDSTDLLAYVATVGVTLTERREWDLNPRKLAPRSFSRAVHSSALPSLQTAHVR
jgi:hypothetical protein